MNIDHPAPEQYGGLRQLWKTVFQDDDAFLDSFFSTAFSPARCRCVTLGGQIAAALYWLDCRYEGGKLAYLYAVATAPAHRGQGLCSALMADTHTILASQGYRGAVLCPAEPRLFEMYGNMGYTVLSGMDTVEYRAGPRPAALRALTPADFAREREKYLPRGGIRQEGGSLAFLSGFCRLYAGEDFTLVTGGGEEFMGIELLGNADAAPGILAALGKERGKFRIPGKTPFAMYRPLQPGGMPTYLELAFD